MRKGFLAIVSLVLLLETIGCQKAGDAIKIGVAAQMTGSEAKMGNDFKNGVTIAVDEWNSRGGVLGKRIEIIAGDDQADPKQAVAVANKLVNEGVIGVIGHFNSSCSIPASDVYNRGTVPMITPASTNPKLTLRGYRGVFRVCGTDDQQGRVAADFVTHKLMAKRIAIIHDKTTYGQGLADLFKEHIGNNAEVVYYAGITKGDKDFKTVLTSIKEKRPDLIFFGGIYPETGLLVKQAREIGMQEPFLTGDGSIDPKFVEIAGVNAAEGTYLTFSPDPRRIPAAKSFIEVYEKRFGEIGPYSIYAYEAAHILLKAVKEAGTTDGNLVIQKIHSLEFSGVLGRIRFDDKGDVTEAPYVVWITKEGKFTEHWRTGQ